MYDLNAYGNFVDLVDGQTTAFASNDKNRVVLRFVLAQRSVAVLTINADYQANGVLVLDGNGVLLREGDELVGEKTETYTLDAGTYYFLARDVNSVPFSGTYDATIVSVVQVAPTQTIDQMISDAFVSAKTYIDAKDAGLKAYTDAALAQLMNTTDLTAKLALLEQINTILDGDAATAGFQAWQAALTRLNAIETTASDFKIQTESALQNINNLRISSDNAFTAKIDANKEATDSADSAIAARVLTLETTTHETVTASVATLDAKVTTSVATVQTGINANFAAMKAKAAILFAV